MIRTRYAAAASIAAVVVLLTGCSPVAPKKDAGAAGTDAEAATADVSVLVAKDESGAYSFVYSGPYSDGEGNLSFKDVPRTVKIDFALDAGSLEGLKFMGRGEDAMWIAETSALEEGGSPTEAYKGDQFKAFTTEADGRRMHVIDKNDDGKTYRYALRFDLNGETIQDDPDIGNGGGQ